MGCVPQSKLAKVCAERFPVIENTKEILIIDTLIMSGDTVRLNKTDTAFIICPPNKVITKIKEVRITAENTAKTHLIKQDCTKQIDAKDKEIIKLKKDLSKQIQKVSELKQKLSTMGKFRWRFYGLIGLIILFLLSSRWLRSLPF